MLKKEFATEVTENTEENQENRIYSLPLCSL